MIEQLNSVSIS